MPTVNLVVVLLFVFLDLAGPFFVGCAALLVLFFFKAGLLFALRVRFELVEAPTRLRS